MRTKPSERLTLREVVGRVAEALGRRTWIVPTPAALMRPAVFLMEKLSPKPLSTRAQLNMLVEGLAGDPEPARRELGLEPSPFTPERLRPLLPPAPSTRTPAGAFVALLAAAFALIGAGFARGGDVWTSLLVAGLVLGAGSLALPGDAGLQLGEPGIARGECLHTLAKLRFERRNAGSGGLRRGASLGFRTQRLGKAPLL